MNAERRPMLAANWKMHKSVPESLAFVRMWSRRVAEGAALPDPTQVELVLCPTLPALWPVAGLLDAMGVAVGAQNVDVGTEGAVTGGVSGHLLAEALATHVIVGHSERRRLFAESDAVVAAKAAAAFSAGLTPIVCVGESSAERQAGETQGVVARQLTAVLNAVPEGDGRLVVAYEPLWAIGTGQGAVPADANQVAGWCRALIAAAWGPAANRVRVLYGGSVTGDNILGFWHADELDGALVGGASLELESWLAMVRTVAPAPSA
ncbi:MAG: triose-phosphate isomerase [Thermaerobacter sp.]|nr:triose-phosphate isomerase [Thermaerobacter sp.]